MLIKSRKSSEHWNAAEHIMAPNSTGCGSLRCRRRFTPAPVLARLLLLTACLLLLSESVCCQVADSPWADRQQDPLCVPTQNNTADSHYFKTANVSVVIGALFPLFELSAGKGNGAALPFADVSEDGIRKACGLFRDFIVLDHIEVFSFLINKRYKGRLTSSVSGHNLSMGYTIADTCSSLFVSSRMALRFGAETPLRDRKSFCGLRAELLPVCSAEAGGPEEEAEPGNETTTTAASTAFGTADMGDETGMEDGGMCQSGAMAPERNMAITVGLTESRVVLPVSTIFTLEKLTHISPSATGNGFINHSEGQLPFFFRTVPPDESQAQALIDIALHFNWTYIIALASSNDNYGTPGLIKLEEVANAKNVCIAYKATFSTDDPLIDVVLEDIVTQLKVYDEAKAVILFARRHEATALFEMIRKHKDGDEPEAAAKLDKVWLGSDYWGTASNLANKLKTLNALPPVALVVRPRLPLEFDGFMNALEEEYIEHLLSLDTAAVRSQTANPWLCRFWENLFNCGDACDDDYKGRTPSNRSCDDPSFRLHDRSVIEKTIPRMGWTRNVLASTELAIQATKLLLDSIPANTSADEVAHILLGLANGEAMRKAVVDVKFPCSPSGDQCQLITDTSEPTAAFDIANFDSAEGGDVGHWQVGVNGSQDPLYINESSIVWSALIGPSVVSSCQEPCPIGQGQKSRTDRPCCFDCINCTDREMAPEDGSGECKSCGDGYRASANKTACKALPERYLDWGDPIGIVLTVVVAVCMMLVFLTLAVFFYYRQSPVAKASDYNLMVLILIGMLVGYAVSLLQIGRPSVVHCTIAKLAQSPPFIFTTATLLIKTSRLARMAKAAQKMKFSRQWTLGIAAQVVFIAIVSLVGIMLDLSLTLTKMPSILPSHQTDETYLLCQYDPARSAVLDSYVVILIVITSVFAFVTRKMPMNFNEARHIFLTSFCLCAVWGMLAPPIYFSGGEYVAVLYSLRLITHMLAIWLFLFTPRLYIFLFRKHRNSIYADQDSRASSRRRRRPSQMSTPALSAA